MLTSRYLMPHSLFSQVRCAQMLSVPGQVDGSSHLIPPPPPLPPDPEELLELLCALVSAVEVLPPVPLELDPVVSLPPQPYTAAVATRAAEPMNNHVERIRK